MNLQFEGIKLILDTILQTMLPNETDRILSRYVGKGWYCVEIMLVNDK